MYVSLWRERGQTLTRVPPQKARFPRRLTKKSGQNPARAVRGKRRHAARGGAVHQGNDVSYAMRTSHLDARDARRGARGALRRLEAPPMLGDVRGGASRRAPRGRRRAASSTRASRRGALARSRRGRRAARVDTFQRRRPPDPAFVRDRALAPRSRARARRPVGDRRLRGGRGPRASRAPGEGPGEAPERVPRLRRRSAVRGQEPARVLRGARAHAARGRGGGGGGGGRRRRFDVPRDARAIGGGARDGGFGFGRGRRGDVRVGGFG